MKPITDKSKRTPRLKVLAAAYLLAGFLTASFSASAGAQGSEPGAEGQVVGWGEEKYDGQGDLARAIDVSKDKARLDLSANILTYVKVKTVDKITQENGQTKETFKRVTVTKVVQLLREVSLSKPQVDEKNRLVTTEASVSKLTARLIVQDCMTKMKIKEEEYNKNMARLRTLTDGGQFYYKKKVERVENMDDLNHMTEEMDKLKEELIHEKLRDIMDVRNAIKTRFLKEFPKESQVTYLAYIRMDQYKAIIDNYDKEVYGKITSITDGSMFQHSDPWNTPNVAEAVLPAKVYQGFGVGDRYAYIAGVDPEFDIGLNGFLYHAEGHLGLSAGLGLSFCPGGNDITKNSPYRALGYDRAYDFHVPIELNAFLYLHEVKSEKHIPFIKLGLVGVWSLDMVQNSDLGLNKDLSSQITGGLIFGVGFTIFHKSGLFLNTLDFGLDFQWLPSGFYNEGTQVGIGFFNNFGV